MKKHIVTEYRFWISLLYVVELCFKSCFSAISRNFHLRDKILRAYPDFVSPQLLIVPRNFQAVQLSTPEDFDYIMYVMLMFKLNEFWSYNTTGILTHGCIAPTHFQLRSLTKCERALQKVFRKADLKICNLLLTNELYKSYMFKFSTSCPPS